MSDPPSPDPSAPLERAAADRLDSWKEIAAYLRRDVTTVQRWEKREGMPVHRHLHDKKGSVYAFGTELDAWTRSRNPLSAEDKDAEPLGDPSERSTAVVDEADRTFQPVASPTSRSTSARRRRFAVVWSLTAGGLVLALVATWALLDRRDYFWRNPLTDATFQSVTDFGGTEQAAAVSRDGRFVAFLSDRDARADVWVTQVGTGQFHNLTRGRVHELVNPSVRTLGFSPDGALVTFWTRKQGSAAGDIGIWAIPTLGGEPRPYLEGVAEFDWSSDGSRLVYHTPGPGDPMFVRDSAPIDARRADLRGGGRTSRPLSRLGPGQRVHLFRPGIAARCHGHLAHQANRRSGPTDHVPQLPRQPPCPAEPPDADVSRQ